MSFLNLFGRGDKSESVSSSSSTTSTTTNAQNVEGTEGIAGLHAGGNITIADPNTVAAAQDIINRGLDVVKSGESAAFDYGRDVLSTAIKQSYGLVSENNKAAEDLIGKIQAASLQSQTQIAAASRQEQTATLETITKYILIAVVIVLSIYFWRR